MHERGGLADQGLKALAVVLSLAVWLGVALAPWWFAQALRLSGSESADNAMALIGWTAIFWLPVLTLVGWKVANWFGSLIWPVKRPSLADLAKQTDDLGSR
jgi:hypothetical protein